MTDEYHSLRTFSISIPIEELRGPAKIPPTLQPRDALERVAYAICKVVSDDPDEFVLDGTPRWVGYLPEARAAIDEMERGA